MPHLDAIIKHSLRFTTGPEIVEYDAGGDGSHASYDPVIKWLSKYSAEKIDSGSVRRNSPIACALPRNEI